MEPEFDDKLKAAVDMVGRTGAKNIQIRYSDDEEPTVWFCVATYDHSNEIVYETASAMEPLPAILRLLEKLIDGSMCTHCKRPAGIDTNTTSIDPLPLNGLFCWYQYDPELKTFRRGCEGD